MLMFANLFGRPLQVSSAPEKTVAPLTAIAPEATTQTTSVAPLTAMAPESASLTTTAAPTLNAAPVAAPTLNAAPVAAPTLNAAPTAPQTNLLSPADSMGQLLADAKRAYDSAVSAGGADSTNAVKAYQNLQYITSYTDPSAHINRSTIGLTGQSLADVMNNVRKAQSGLYTSSFQPETPAITAPETPAITAPETPAITAPETPAITAPEPTPTPTAIDPVAQVFQEVLGRAPTISELRTYGPQIEQGLSTPDLLKTELTQRKGYVDLRDAAQKSYDDIVAAEGADSTNAVKAYQKLKYLDDYATYGFATAGTTVGLSGKDLNEFTNLIQTVPNLGLDYKPEQQSRLSIDQLYGYNLGRAANADEINYWYDKLKSGDISWNDVVTGIVESQEAKAYRAAHPVTYWDAQKPTGDYTESGEPVLTQYTPEQYAKSVNSIYEGLLGRPASAEELKAIQNQVTESGLTLSQLQKNILNSSEFKTHNANTGVGVWVSSDVNGKTTGTYVPSSVINLPGAAYAISRAANPNGLVNAISSDPKAWLKNQFTNLAYGLGWESKLLSGGVGIVEAVVNSGYSYGDTNKYLNDRVNRLNDQATWLIKNGVMTSKEVEALWNKQRSAGGNAAQKGVLDQIHPDDGGWMGLGKVGDQFGDFLEKYQLPIMTAILGGAVLGPAIGAAVGAAPGSATAVAVNAATTGLTQTAVALASGAPTNKALIAGGLAAAGVGVGGALGPSGLDVAGTLVNAGVNPVVASVAVGALSGAATGALSSAVTGKDVGEGVLGGALAGGVASGLSSATKVLDGVSGTLVRLAANTAVGMLSGKDISAALQGAAVGVVTSLAGSATKAAIDATKKGATDIDVSGKITPNADTVAAMRKAAEEELNNMLGNSDPESVKKYVASLPESYFTDTLKAVDSDTSSAIKLAASYPTEAVKELYKEETGAEPSAENLSKYADALRNGTSLADIKSEIQSSPEAIKYAARDTETDVVSGGEGTDIMTGGAGKDTISGPSNVTIYGDTGGTSDKTGQGATTEEVATWFAKQSPDVKDYFNTLKDDPSYINPDTGKPFTPSEAMVAANSIFGDANAVNITEGAASVGELDVGKSSGSFFDAFKDIGAILGTGTSDPTATLHSLFGYGASGWENKDGFSLIAFDNPVQKQQTMFNLQAVIDDPKATPQEKAIAEIVKDKVDKVQPKTTGGEKAGSTTLETPTKPGGDTGGGGTSTSVAPSGKPGESSASTEAIDAALNSITTTTLTAKQVQELTDPSSATAKAAASVSPGSLSVAKINSDVNAMYQTLLGHDADAEGLNYWVKQIQEGKMTLADVASAIANSEAAKNKQGTGTGTTGTATTGTGTGTTGTSGTGTTSAGTGTGTAGTGTSTGTTGTGTGTGGGTGGGAGTGTGTGTGATEGTGTGTGTGSSTGSGTGGSGTGTGSGTGSGTGGGGTGGGTGGGSGTGTNLQYYIPSLTQTTSGLNTKFPNLTADVVGGPATIDLGGEFGAPVISNMTYTPIGGLTFASGGSVDPLDTSEEISADTSDQSSGADVITGGTTSIDLGGEFAATPTTYNVTTGAKNYADGGIIGGDAGGMVFEGGWPAMQLARMRANRFKQLANVPQVSGTAFAQGGHVPEFYSEGGLNNRYVTGNGDGTSDDVPAMLANGEFVIPADVVSALGNGSNDSGASVLDEFLQVIRAHKQNHDPKQLPPDSLGPLAYLNKATKKAGK